MPLRDFECIPCQSTPEERLYTVKQGEITLPSCQTCGADLTMLHLSSGRIYGKSAVFPYTTTHVSGDGRPVTVESLGHLRQLERRYGVCFSGFSQDPGNPDSPRDLPVKRPGGRAYQGPRAPWMEG